MSPNRNYLRGRSMEYRQMNRLKNDGYDIIIRSAGSHSKIDLLGIRKKDRRIKCIQCKPHSMSKNKADAIEDDLSWLNDEFVSEFEVVSTRKYKRKGGNR